MKNVLYYNNGLKTLNGINDTSLVLAQLSAYHLIITSPKTATTLAEDLAILKSLSNLNPDVKIAIRVDMASYTNGAIDTIYADYGTLANYIFLDNCDYAGAVTRTAQNTAMNYVRSKNYMVAFNAANPQHVLDNVIDATYNPTGSSIAIQPNDIFVVDNVLANNVWLSKLNFIEQLVVSTRLLKYRNLLKALVVSTDIVGSYNTQATSANRQIVWDIGNFCGFDYCGFAAEPTFYGAAESTVKFLAEVSTVTNIGPNFIWSYTDDNTITRSDSKKMLIPSTVNVATYA
jgi:hypothetical protein